MDVRTTLAFGLAAWIGLIGTGVLRRMARAQARASSHTTDRDLRRLAGVVLAAATLAGWLVVPGTAGWLGATALGAAVVAAAGLATDFRVVPGSTRLLVIAAAAALVVATGVRGAVLGAPGLDAVFTAAWIVLVTSAFVRLVHADDLAATTALLAALGLFGVTVGHDDTIAVAAVALAGACIALLAYTVRPASVAAGRAGIGFAGFVLAVLTVQLDAPTAEPGGLLVPVLLVGLPVVDMFTVATTRLWHGDPLRPSRRDHLVDRLRARGWSRARAVSALIAAQAGLTTLAVLVGRDLVAVAWVLVGVAALVIALAVGARRTPSPLGLPRPRGRLVLEVGLGVLIVLGALAALTSWQGYRHMEVGQRALDQALTAGRAGDAEAAGTAFRRAADAFATADAWLGNPLGWPARAVPAVAENLRAARELAGGGAEVAGAGARLADASGERLRIRDGTVRVAEVRRLTPDIEAAAALLDEVVARIDNLRRPLLLGPVRDRVDDVRAELVAAADEAGHAVAAAHVAPAIFGADGPRRYFLAVQNPAELRATGGIISNWGILTADNGKVDLDEFRRASELNQAAGPVPRGDRRLEAPAEFLDRYDRFTPAQVWQNLNVSPDFPTVGRLIAGLYPQSTGEFVDGVIAVDPVGLQALLELTGPVVVAGWPVPITAANVVDITLREQYEAFGGTEREEFLGDVAEAVWEQALEGNLGNPARLANILGRAGREGHLQVWFADPEEAALAVRLGVGGAVPPLGSDSLLVTSQNSSANKVDYYLTRTLDYTIRLAPAPGQARAAATADLVVTLDNAAPAGIESIALGPWDDRFEPGENRSFVSVYSPLAFTGATLDGEPVQLETATELGRNIASGFVRVPAGGTRTLAIDLRGTVTLAPDGWYELDVVRQPVLWPDQVTIAVEVPRGWRIAAAEGLEVLGPRRAGVVGPLEQTERLRLRLEPDG